MRIITANLNGIRAAARKGFFDWLKKQDADVVCIQETKAQIHQLEDTIFTPEAIIVITTMRSKKDIAVWRYTVDKNRMKSLPAWAMPSLILKGGILKPDLAD